MSSVIHLFCHGMMAFWYRPPSTSGGKDDGYTILLPQSPHNMHDLRLTTTPGGAPQGDLKYGSHAQPTKKFSIAFQARSSVKNRGRKTASHCLSLYQYNGNKLDPAIDLAKSSGVAFTLDIPYPTDEVPIRVESYKSNPYVQGTTVSDFGIEPVSLPRSTMFTFEVDDPTIPVQLLGGATPVDLFKAPLPQVVKIYLYSQPPDYVAGNHLDSFNEMFSYSSHTKLDLKVVAPSVKNPCVPLLAAPRPVGVDIEDIQELMELKYNSPGQYDDLCTHKVASSKDHGDDRLRLFTLDPAECVQGPGC